MTANSSPAPLPIVVLISGSGSNLQAIIDATKNTQATIPPLNVDIQAVISNRDNAYGLVRAQQAGIPTHVIKHGDFASREAFDQALQQQIDQYQPKLVVLAGFMRFLTEDFVRHYLGALINIHPSLLPKYPGLNTHQQVLAAGDCEHGVTIHFVTPELDGGPTIAQARLLVNPDDNNESLKQRIHALEHELYPEVLSWFASGRVSLREGAAYLDGSPVAL